jgi:hypothetical protein
MRAKEFITEITAGSIQIGEWTILISDHAYVRADQRIQSDYAVVDSALRKVPAITKDLAKLDVNSRIWAYDEENNISIGLRRRSGNTVLLGSVLSGQAWDSDVPRINLPKNAPLSTVKGSFADVGKTVVKPAATVKPQFRAPGHMPDRDDQHDPHKDLKVRPLKIIPDMLK